MSRFFASTSCVCVRLSAPANRLDGSSVGRDEILLRISVPPGEDWICGFPSLLSRRDALWPGIRLAEEIMSARASASDLSLCIFSLAPQLLLFSFSTLCFSWLEQIVRDGIVLYFHGHTFARARHAK